MIRSHVTFIFNVFQWATDNLWNWADSMNDRIVLRRESEVSTVRFCLLSNLEKSYLIDGLMYESIYPNKWPNSLEAENIDSLRGCFKFLPLYYLYSVTNIYWINENTLYTFIFNTLHFGWPAFPIPIRWTGWVLKI